MAALCPIVAQHAMHNTEAKQNVISAFDGRAQAAGAHLTGRGLTHAETTITAAAVVLPTGPQPGRI